MSDYMFMLESHLSQAQNAAIAEIQRLMARLQINVFLTGGALRDMLASLPVRDLNFTLEGSPLKLLRALEKDAGVAVQNADDVRKSYEIVFPNGVLAEISMARIEKYAKPGGAPKVTPATIHEDLRGRDFSINCLAVSLAKGSRGLLLDPTNGLSDFGLRELRTVSPYTLLDDPSRILKLVTLQARLGFQLDERTKRQYESARERKLEALIAPEALRREIVKIGEEFNPVPILEALEREGFLELYFPGFKGTKLNTAGFGKLQKLRGLIPFGAQMKEDRLAIFLWTVSEKWTPKEKQAFANNCKLTKRELDAWKNLETKAKKLSDTLKSPKLQKPSLVHQALLPAPLEQILVLLYQPGSRTVQDRIRNYLQRYLPLAMEVDDSEVLHAGLDPTSPKGIAMKKQLIAAKLDARPRKPAPTGEPVYSPPPSA
jgi:tRNA nucleotidyltransferase (CCA-adding enzyme)